MVMGVEVNEANERHSSIAFLSTSWLLRNNRLRRGRGDIMIVNRGR